MKHLTEDQRQDPKALQKAVLRDRITAGLIRYIRLWGHGPRAALEKMENRFWYEPSARCIHVPVPTALLLIREETLREQKVQMILRTRHRHIE